MKMICVKLWIMTAGNAHSGLLTTMADSRLAPSQWETALLCNGVSHWLGVISPDYDNASTLKTESCHDANFVVAGGTAGCSTTGDDKVGIATTQFENRELPWCQFCRCWWYRRLRCTPMTTKLASRRLGFQWICQNKKGIGLLLIRS